MEGTQALVAALQRIKAPFDRDALAPEVVKACQPVADAMRQGAPRLTGEGAESIQAREVRGENPNVIVVAIGPDREHWYLRYAEFGTGHQPAHPFLRPGWDREEAGLLSRLRHLCGGLIKGAV